MNPPALATPPPHPRRGRPHGGRSDDAPEEGSESRPGTTPTPLVLFGNGGHAREVAQIVRDIAEALAPKASHTLHDPHNPHPGPWRLLGALADAGAAAAHPGGLPLLGGLDWLDAHPEVALLVAVGDPAARARIATAARARNPRLRLATLVHPSAWCADGVRLGEGSVVFAGCLLNAGAQVGTQAVLNLGCSLSHDVVLGDAVSLGPGVRLAGGVRVGDGCDIGVGACATPRVRIGAGCTVGAGAVVVGDLPAGCTAVGVPARPLPR